MVRPLTFIIMFPRGTSTTARCISRRFYYFSIVFVTLCSLLVSVQGGFFDKSFFFGSSSGNSLWDELYEKCGNRVSFHCVQSRLMNYINTTLDSDLHITDGIYFVKSTHRFQMMDSSTPATSDAVFGNSTYYHSRSGRAVKKNVVTITDNNIENTTEPFTEEPAEEEEFANFVRTVEKVEKDIEQTEKYEETTTTTTTTDIPVNSSTTTTTTTTTTRPIPPSFEEDEEDHPKDENLVIRSLNKVTDILYDKTTDYLSSHDLKLDLPQTLFGGSKVRISPRGYDADGGIILKLNVYPAETPRTYHVTKYIHKMFKKKLLTSFLALLLIIKLIKIKLMYVLPVIIGVNAAKKLLLKVLLFLFPPLTHLFKLCTFYHAHAAKLHYHHHKIKHHHHHIKVPVPVPVPVPSHKPHSHYDAVGHGSHGHDEYEGPGILDHEPPAYDGHPSYGTPEYYTRNDMGSVSQHGDELASWGLKDFYVSTESPGVLSAQAQAYSPYAEQNYKVLSQASKYANAYKDSLTSATSSKKNKISNSIWKNKPTLKNTLLTPYDPFYSPILQKIDGIFTQLGFTEEGCRERLICSMYKNPVRFSPHSNLLSTELSRDPAELERPSQNNPAAVRFYRYVESARDGQSQKDCLSLYPDCVVKTE
ncbi:uncharacterized protein Osi17 isoform X2 [Planococcus citri]|uniref:uncharacterized protein Osi17 isoform X2 n=1 Tax=Planococcus citri TaxID=170843 RepID=UPI0031F761CA